jgi:hypothetical protein
VADLVIVGRSMNGSGGMTGAGIGARSGTGGSSLVYSLGAGHAWSRSSDVDSLAVSGGMGAVIDLHNVGMICVGLYDSVVIAASSQSRLSSRF